MGVAQRDYLAVILGRGWVRHNATILRLGWDAARLDYLAVILGRRWVRHDAVISGGAGVRHDATIPFSRLCRVWHGSTILRLSWTPLGAAWRDYPILVVILEWSGFNEGWHTERKRVW
jgi:hypothetical protein